MNDDTAEKIRNAVEAFSYSLLEEDEAERTFRDRPQTKEEREQELFNLEDVQFEVRTALQSSEYDWVFNIANDVVSEQGFDDFDKTGKPYQFLCRELLKAIDRTVTVQLNRYRGIYTNDFISAQLADEQKGPDKAQQTYKRAANRPPAKWDAIESKLREMAARNELVLHESGSIHRKQTAIKLREWYANTHNDEGFQKPKTSAEDTIVRNMSQLFDDLEAQLKTKSG